MILEGVNIHIVGCINVLHCLVLALPLELGQSSLVSGLESEIPGLTEFSVARERNPESGPQASGL